MSRFLPIRVAMPILFLLVSSPVLTAAHAQESPYKAGPGKYPRFESKEAEPGLQYGSVADLPLPKTVLYSVSPDELLADGEAWRKLGFEGFFITGVAPEWSVDVWGTDGEPWTIGASDKNFQKVKQANELCRRIGAETFLTMAFSHTFDWFDDLAWQKIEDNFRQFALFARESGCTGLAIDIEYIWPQYHFNWAGYDYEGYSRKDLVDTIRRRATQIARALYDTFPAAPLLTLPESAFSLGSWVQSAWVEEAARRAASGGVHLCTEGTYRRPNPRYMLGSAWLDNAVMLSTLSGAGRSYWTAKCSIAEGMWPFGADADDYHGGAPSPEEFRQAFAASLMAGARYNWIYSHDAREKMLGRDKAPLEGQAPMSEYLRIIQAREVITDAAYMRAAQDLRRMAVRDYSSDLGLVIVPTLAGPREEMEVGLMPERVYAPAPIAKMERRLWDVGTRVFKGEEVDFQHEFSTQPEWLLLGPFDNTGGQGFAAAYPPEERISPKAVYDGVGGKVRWQQYAAPPKRMSIDLAKVYEPSEQVCAYALCYAVCDEPRDVQVRVGANDCWKLWVGGKAVFENAEEGRIILDRDIVPVSLPAGATPILLKVCNNKKDWGFVFRVTDAAGNPDPKVTLRLNP